MKIQYKNIVKNLTLIIMTLTLATTFGTSFAYAEPFSFTETLKKAAEAIIPSSIQLNINTKETEEVSGKLVATTTIQETLKKIEKIDEGNKIISDEEKTACDYFDDSVSNVLTLESASDEAKQKLEKVGATIEDESVARDSILNSLKSLFGLKENDKIVFSSMKKDISEANDYYDNLDTKVMEVQVFLDANYCENVKLERASKTAVETSAWVDDEVLFRKKFVTNLKEKMKILQDGVKNAKK